MIKKCKNCIHYFKGASVCRRFPKEVFKKEYEWCGEFDGCVAENTYFMTPIEELDKVA